MDRAFFEWEGPLSKRPGGERAPSIRKMIVAYCFDLIGDVATAEEAADRYIAGWLELYADKLKEKE